jgi:hypothetical protein
VVAGEEPQVIGLQRRGSQLQRFAKFAAPPIAFEAPHRRHRLCRKSGVFFVRNSSPQKDDFDLSCEKGDFDGMERIQHELERRRKR